jgi:ribosomal protein S18 acetylase RimI-like enzyme
MSDKSEVSVKKAGADDTALVGEIMADAFSEDPVGKWISPDPEYPGWCWPKIVPFLLPHNEVYIASDGLGALLGVPPGAELNIRPNLAMLWNLWWRFGIGSILRFGRIMKMLEQHHPKAHHYYLLGLGVRPDSRCKGIGSALLEHILKECDQQKTGVYLENSNPLNMKFYQRHGFKTQNEVTLPHNGPTLWLMYREPMSDRV